MKLPKTRLRDIVHALAEPLESISTADWSVQDLCRMIWILGRVKPNTLISQFKAKTYGQLNKKFGLRARIIEGKMGKMDQDMEAVDVLICDPQHLNSRAIAHGFLEEWLGEPATSKAKGSGGLQHFRVRQLTHIEGAQANEGLRAFSLALMDAPTPCHC